VSKSCLFEFAGLESHLLARVEEVVAGSWIDTGTPYQSEQGETDKQTTHEASSIE
jgi:hypothetical protein